MSSVNNNRPHPTPAPTPGSASAAQTPAAPKANSSSPTTQPGQDQFDPTQASAQFQASINQEILPNNGGEHGASAHGKAHHGKKADDAIDPNDPSTQPVGTNKA